MRHTTHIWESSAPAAAAEAVGGAASMDWATASSASAVSSSSLALESNWKASVCAPRLWQMAWCETTRQNFSVGLTMLHIFYSDGFPWLWGSPFSGPAFSTPAIWCRVFQFRVFQSRVFSAPELLIASELSLWASTTVWNQRLILLNPLTVVSINVQTKVSPTIV